MKTRIIIVSILLVFLAFSNSYAEEYFIVKDPLTISELKKSGITASDLETMREWSGPINIDGGKVNLPILGGDLQNINITNLLFAWDIPPGPTFFQLVFGGRLNYKELGIDIVVWALIPEEYNPEKYANFWDPDKPFWIPEGSKVLVTVSIETGRESIDRPVTVWLSNPNPPYGMNKIHEFSNGYSKVEIDTKGRSNENKIRVYAKGEGRNEKDNYASIYFVVIPRNQALKDMKPVETRATDIDTGTPQQRLINPNPNAGKGNLMIRVFEDQKCTLPSKINRITIYWEGRKLAAVPIGEDDNGICYIPSVPAGKITISYPYSSKDNWIIKKRCGNPPWKLENGQTLQIDMFKGKEGE